MMLFLCYIVWITSVISSSDDSISSSNDDNDNSEYKGILDGEYRDASGQLFQSLCTADNGNIYGTAGPVTGNPLTEFVNTIGRSTSGVTKLSDNIYQATFDVFQFNANETGVLRVTATFTKNTNTGVATFSIPGAGAINVTSISNKGTHCLIPDGNWNEANDETPFMVTSDKLPTDLCELHGITNCVTIGSFEDKTSCYGIYDLDTNQFVGGGNQSVGNVQIMWDGELRISDFTMSLGSCTSGTTFYVWTKEEEEVTVSWKCATANVLQYIYVLSEEADVLEEVEDEKCLLFSGISAAKQMSEENDKNENVNSNVVNNEEIVIKFSNATIGNLCAILIVFMLVTIIMYWFSMRNKSI